MSAINETVIKLVDTIIENPDLWWVKILAIVGAFSIFTTLLSSGGSLITAFTHIFGFFKWVYHKLKGKDI